MPSSVKKKKSSKKLSRSVRLRKYELVYDACMKKTFTVCKNPKHTTSDKNSCKKTEKTTEKEPKSEKVKKCNNKKKISPNKSKDRKRPLNAYQKFVREESHKNKYKGMSSTERMSAISKKWKNKLVKI